MKILRKISILADIRTGHFPNTATNVAAYAEMFAFEVSTAVVIKSSIFWDMMLCSPLKVNRRFGGTCRHLLGQRISRARN
jgi:hypothetical protein